MRSSHLATLSFLALGVAACDHGSNVPIAFPKRAYLGETVATAIDTDSSLIPAWGKNYALSSENVRIQLMDVLTEETQILTPRAVMVGSSVSGTAFTEYEGTTEVSIAVFDLPATLPEDFTEPPSDVWVIPVFYPSLQPIALEMYSALRILGPANEGEGSTTFVPHQGPPEFALPIEKKLEPLPALRIRAKTTQFPAGWAIGAVQFDVTYPASVSNPRAYGRNKAARALAHAGNVATGRARVILVDPIELELKDSAARGPFVDIVFDQSAPFAASSFHIENLIVTSVDGAVLVNDPGNSEEFFLMYARAND
jgi:hypothetical protein